VETALEAASRGHLPAFSPTHSPQLALAPDCFAPVWNTSSGEFDPLDDETLACAFQRLMPVNPSFSVSKFGMGAADGR
jgi:hypothetical protein